MAPGTWFGITLRVELFVLHVALVSMNTFVGTGPGLARDQWGLVILPVIICKLL